LRESHKLLILETRMLRKMFGLENAEISDQFRMLHNKELHDLYELHSVVRVVHHGKVGMQLG
jgi:hypothetical protein